jgi:DNA mismatch endonuclease (patch repair protein)
MRRVRRAGTEPELAVRRVLSDLGLRYTLRNRDLPGSPDIANRRKRFAIFVHGCFWHRHAGCRRTTTPKANRAFWEAKFEANIMRDRRAIRDLKRLGYRVVVIWECRVNASDRITSQVSAILGGRLK